MRRRPEMKRIDAVVSELEKANSDLALEVAREGIVLLENNGALPIKSKKIALYGAGARNTAKGGTGSGEVNNRHSVSIEEGLETCGFEITSKNWLDDCDECFRKEEAARDEKIRRIGKRYSAFRFWDLMNAINLPIIFPSGRDINISDVTSSDTDTAIYVVTRQAGEGADRRDAEGEYRLLEKEIKDIKLIVENYKNTVVVINSGASIDAGPILDLNPGAVVYMGQAGQQGGLALAELLSGKYGFSGKLAASWPNKLSDLPCSDSFSYLDGNTDRELYKDGIYVGYRYFDTFGVKPRYAFGYGLSYTRFEVAAKARLDGTRVTVTATVSNVGKTEGKEVVQIYLSCPSVTLKREYQQLAAFAKTGVIKAGDKCDVTASFVLTDFAAYDENRSCFVLERGDYVVRVGNSSANTVPIAAISLKREYVTEKCREIRGSHGRVAEIVAPTASVADEKAGERFELSDGAVVTVENDYSFPVVKSVPETKKMTDKELAALCVGDPSLMTGGITDVVGACGEINRKVCKKYGYKPAVMADGPAGLRLAINYGVEPDGKIKTDGKLPADLVKAKKLFAFLDGIWSRRSGKAEEKWQLCTAWPSATVQAQSFLPEIVEKVGKATSEEMEKYGVGIWLAPGMNIQRHPLCGRNFEYYSEDPVLSAKMASALTRGVQSSDRCAVTIKHYCCNNQEDNRMKSSSEVNERALREIYLKAFKLTVRDSRPKCVMTSYNKVNGTYVNSSYDLIVNTLRCEFGFDGLVMTDWQSVGKGQAVAGEVLAAENDIIMAGDGYQYKELLKAVKTGQTDRKLLEKSASRILNLCRELSGKKD